MRPWRYAIGMLGTSIPINMVRASMLLYYVDLLGLDVRAYGTVMAIYAVIDALDNPVLGHLSDRTRTRWGRRKPWLAVAIPLLAAAFIGFFSAPSSLDGAQLVIWFAVFAILTEAADSMFNANYASLLPEAFPAEGERAIANSMRQGLQLVAMVLSVAVTPWLATAVLGTEDSTIGFSRTAMMYAVVSIVALSIMVTGIRENTSRQRELPPGFFRSALGILRTKLFWQVGIASACYLVPLAITLGGLQLYVKYTLGLPVARTTELLAVVIAVAGVALAIWTPIVRRVGAPRVWRLAFVFLAGGYVPMYFANTLGTAIASASVVGIGWAGLLATNDLIQSRLLDDDARRHGVHREGLYFAAFGVFSRLTGALNGVFLASLGLFFGYYSGANPGPNPDDAFRTLVCVYPFVIAVAGAILARTIRVPEAGAKTIPPASD